MASWDVPAHSGSFRSRLKQGRRVRGTIWLAQNQAPKVRSGPLSPCCTNVHLTEPCPQQAYKCARSTNHRRSMQPCASPRQPLYCVSSSHLREEKESSETSLGLSTSWPVWQRKTRAEIDRAKTSFSLSLPSSGKREQYKKKISECRRQKKKKHLRSVGIDPLDQKICEPCKKQRCLSLLKKGGG